MRTAWIGGLRNCWKEQTAACLVMDPARFTAILATAKEMTDLGVDLADGSTPDPFHLLWCGDVNGFVELTNELRSGSAGSNAQSVQRTAAVLWVSLKTASLSWSHWAPTYDIATTDIGKNTVDVTYHYRSDEHYTSDQNQPCSRTATADAAFNRVPVPYRVGMRVDKATDTFYDGGNLKPGGEAGTWTTLTTPVDVSDSCAEATSYDQNVIWTDVPGSYGIRVDRAKGDILAEGTTTLDTGAWLRKVTIHADVHVDGLHAFLAKGP
jgi:hypothetical protein